MSSKSSSGGSTQQLTEFRAAQEEMLNLSREYSQQRQAVWAEELQGLKDSWDGFSQEWQGSLSEMTSQATTQFQELAANGEAAAGLISQSWGQTLTSLTSGVDDWAAHFLQSLQQVASAWLGAAGAGGGSGGGGSGFMGLVGNVLDFGGLFHQGGVVTAHQGMVVAPESLMGDEQLILAQSGEGILPRDAMSRLGEGNFEALRSGNFNVGPGGGGPSNNITIQVQSLDAAGVAGLDWERVVQRHLLPHLQKEMNRRW